MKIVDEISSDEPLRAADAVSVLVADDESAVRRFVVRVLEHEGYTVAEARDGAEALEILKLERSTFSVVVSDIVMPRLNGVELMQELSVLLPGLPVILMSGYATAALAELGIAAPCSILPKPFPSERLIDEVRRCVRKIPR
jgi:DNA-binding NtrC family response regulator